MSNNQEADAMDIHNILRMLPHRFPMLLVDRITQCLPGKSIHGIKNVTRADDFMQRAVQGKDVQGMPLLLVIEALAQVSVILTYKSLGKAPARDDLMFFAGIDKARFDGHVAIGETIELNCELLRIRKNAGWFSGRASVRNQVVCEVEMIAAWKAG